MPRARHDVVVGECNGSSWDGRDHQPVWAQRQCAQPSRTRVLESLLRFPSPFLSFPFSLPPSSVLARPNMLLAGTFLPLLLFISFVNALRNGRLLKHQLETGLGREPIRRRSLKDAAFTVEVIYRYISPSIHLTLTISPTTSVEDRPLRQRLRNVQEPILDQRYIL